MQSPMPSAADRFNSPVQGSAAKRKLFSAMTDSGNGTGKTVSSSTSSGAVSIPMALITDKDGRQVGNMDCHISIFIN